ncbi:hypothetical protein SNEBB_006185 [Seison nebaliae]|nr:hypothetical protein SNEBB_006185 [Seison nebaliae]
MFYLTVFLFFFLQHITSSYNVNEYKDHKIISIIPRSENDLDTLKEFFEHNNEIDVWSMPRVANVPVTFRIPPIYHERTIDFANQNNFNYTTEDISKLILIEKRSMADVRAKRYARQSIIGRYVSYDEIKSYMIDMAHQNPQYKFGTIGMTYEKRQIPYLQMGTGQKGIIIEAGAHAREWIAIASAVNIIDKLHHTPDLLNKFTFYIFPMANPDGYEYSRNTQRLWRKNRQPTNGYCKGSDINRNFDFHWGVSGSSTYSCSEKYAGAYGNSELETKAFSKFIENHKDTLVGYFALHSYGQLWLVPYGYRQVSPPDVQDLMDVAQVGAKAMYDRNHEAKFTVGNTAKVLYASSGGSDDYAKGIHNVKYSYTIELAPTDSSSYGFVLPQYLAPSACADAWTGIKAALYRIHAKSTEHRQENANVQQSPKYFTTRWPSCYLSNELQLLQINLNNNETFHQLMKFANDHDIDWWRYPTTTHRFGEMVMNEIDINLLVNKLKLKKDKDYHIVRNMEKLMNEERDEDESRELPKKPNASSLHHKRANRYDEFVNRMKIFQRYDRRRSRRALYRKHRRSLDIVGHYANLTDIHEWLSDLPKKYSNVQFATIGRTTENRPIDLLRIGNGADAILIDAGIHAREWLASASCLCLTEQLIKLSKEPLFRRYTFFVIPMINPDGYEYSRRVHINKRKQLEYRIWRKNRGGARESSCVGVDLNRNFGKGFGGEGSSKNPCSNIFNGGRPFSEKETRTLRMTLKTIQRNFNLLAYVTLHTYGRLVLFPWSHRKGQAPFSKPMHSLAKKIANVMKTTAGRPYTYGTSSNVLYISSGSSDDWAKSSNVPFTYTIELDPDDKMISDNNSEISYLGAIGFIVPKSMIKKTCTDLRLGMTELVKELSTRNTRLRLHRYYYRMRKKVY